MDKKDYSPSPINTDLETLTFSGEESIVNLKEEKRRRKDRIDKLYNRKNILLKRWFKYLEIKEQKPVRLFFSGEYSRVKSICDKTSKRISDNYYEIIRNESVVSDLEDNFGI